MAVNHDVAGSSPAREVHQIFRESKMTYQQNFRNGYRDMVEQNLFGGAKVAYNLSGELSLGIIKEVKGTRRNGNLTLNILVKNRGGLFYPK